MNSSEHKHQLDQSLALTPHLTNVDPKNHWLYVPECLRVPILQARGGPGIKTISEITCFDSEAIERWLDEEEIVARLIERIAHYKINQSEYIMTAHDI